MMGPPRLFARRAASVAGAGGGLILIALLFDASPLFVPAVAMVLLGLLTPAWVWLSAYGARTERRLQAERVVEDEVLAATIEVRRGPVGLPGAEVRDPFAGARLDVSGAVSILHGSRRTRVRVTSTFPRRGLHVLAPPSLIVEDPLQLARVRREGMGGPQQLLVLPRTETVVWSTANRGRRLRMAEDSSASEAMAAVDVDGLRPYRPGTSASRIHWPAVARGAGLLERRLQADGDSRPLVVLDARGGEATAQLDAAVRAAASLALEFARGGGCGLLLPGEQRPTIIDHELTSWPPAHARLAVVESRGARAPALGPVGSRVGPMIYVAVRTPVRLAGVASGAMLAPVVLVVPTATLSGGRPPGLVGPALPVLEVCGCRGFQLGLRRPAERPAHANREPVA
jgi:uncharacterized protein (DUF58 family)